MSARIEWKSTVTYTWLMIDPESRLSTLHGDVLPICQGSGRRNRRFEMLSILAGTVTQSWKDKLSHARYVVRFIIYVNISQPHYRILNASWTYLLEKETSVSRKNDGTLRMTGLVGRKIILNIWHSISNLRAGQGVVGPTVYTETCYIDFLQSLLMLHLQLFTRSKKHYRNSYEVAINSSVQPSSTSRGITKGPLTVTPHTERYVQHSVVL